MDIYEARRLLVERLIHDLFDGNQARFAEATGVRPSYVTRMLKPAGEKSRKRVGDDMAVKLEAVAALKLNPGDLLNPIVLGRNEPTSGAAQTSTSGAVADDGFSNAVALIAGRLRNADPIVRETAARLLSMLATSPRDVQRITDLLEALMGTKNPRDLEAEPGWPRHLTTEDEPMAPNVKPIQEKTRPVRLVSKLPFKTSAHEKVSKEPPKTAPEKKEDSDKPEKR